MAKAEKLLAHRLEPGGLYDPGNMPLLHHVNQALRAHTLFSRDVDYMVKDGEVVIVDEFTGRLMPGRRWSDGLHQAVEAKEKVKIERENQTLATITFQNYFRKYKKLAGMTGTAETEAEEFGEDLQPRRHRHPDQPAAPAARNAGRDLPDRAARSSTPSSPTSSSSRRRAGRRWSARSRSRSPSSSRACCRRRGIKHVVLNAKYHAQEAEIVAQAGPARRRHDRHQHGRPRHRHPARRQPGVHGAPAVPGRRTGGAPAQGRREVHRRRGVRLLLPPRRASTACRGRTGSASSRTSSRRRDAEHDEVVELGGLHIIGTERHEARRIDNQLRGRAGRQGDPGSSRFYLSLEDDLMRIFGSDRISGLMQRLGMEEGVPIEHGMVTRAIERAQKQVEAPELLRSASTSSSTTT